MICIAAFVILLLIVLCLPIIRIFSKKTADKIWKLFKKSTYCVGRKMTLRKCDSSFKDDIKNSILRKIVLKHPSWTKPVSAAIEIFAVFIIIITIWSLLVSVKAGVSLFVYGTCDVATPSACVLNSTEACSIDSAPPKFFENPVGYVGNWFAEFGEAFAAIPARLKNWDAREYLPENPTYYNKYDAKKPVALDIFDPGCIICNKSYNLEKTSGFFEKYNVALLPYAIENPAGGYKFANSHLIVAYLEATRKISPDENSENSAQNSSAKNGENPENNSGNNSENNSENSDNSAQIPAMWKIIDRLFTEKSPNGDSWQNAFNVGMTEEKARETLDKWLKDFGYSDEKIAQISKLADSDEISQIMKENARIVNDEIKTKKIPTMIFDGKRREGLFAE